MYYWELLHPCVPMIYVHFLVQTATITKCPVKKNTAGKKCIKMHTSIKSSDAYVHDLSFLLDKNTEVVQCSNPLKIQLLILSTINALEDTVKSKTHSEWAMSFGTNVNVKE